MNKSIVSYKSFVMNKSKNKSAIFFRPLLSTEISSCNEYLYSKYIHNLLLWVYTCLCLFRGFAGTDWMTRARS